MKTITLPFEEFEMLEAKSRMFDKNRKTIYVVKSSQDFKYRTFTAMEPDEVFLTLKGQIEELRDTEKNLRNLLVEEKLANFKRSKAYSGFQRFLIKTFKL